MVMSKIILWIKRTGITLVISAAIAVFSQGLMMVPFASASLPSGSLNINELVGNGTSATATDGASSTGAVLEYPTSAVVNNSGNIYVADSQAGELDFVPDKTGTYYGQSMTAGDIYVIAGGSSAQPASGLLATSIKASSLNSVAVDGSGNVYIADADDDIIGFIPNTNGTYFGQTMKADYFYIIAGQVTVVGNPNPGTLATNTDLNGPSVVNLGSNGVYIVSNSEEVNFIPFTNGSYYGQSMTANYIYKLAGTAGAAGNPTSGTLATSTDLNGPDGVAVDSNGDIVIGDHYANEVNFIPATTGTYYGQSMTADYIYTLTSSVNQPADVAIDGSGNIFIANTASNEIDLIPVTTGTYYGQSMTANSLYVIAGDGTGGLSGNGSSSTSAELNGPVGVSLGSSGIFYIADSNNHEVRVVAPPPTFTSAASGTLTYGSAGSITITTTGEPTNNITESGTLPGGVSFVNNNNDTATISGTPTSTGTFNITLTASNSDGSANQSFTLTVNKASQTISITSTAPSETYGSTTNYTPTATATSGLSVTFTIDSSSTSGTCSIASGVVSFASAGTCVIDANQSGNSDYLAAAQVQQSVTVNKESQTITFTSTAPSETYGSTTNYTPAATATSGLSVTFTIDSSSTSGTCSIASGVVSFSAAGTCVIDANQSGNSNYLAAAQVQQSVTVNKESQTISITSTAPSETYGSLTSYTPTATATSGLSVTFSIDATSTPGTCSISGGVVTFSTAGTCVIDANQSGNSDYLAAPQVQQSVTVNEESQTISITSTAPSETYGSTTNYTPAATATSGLSVTFSIDATSTPGTCSITSGVVSFSSPGNCVIDANQSGNSDYAAAPQVQQYVTVFKESQTISITSTAPSETYGSLTSYTPTATATSGLSVTFTIDSSSTSGTCSIASGVVSFSSPGTCVIDANQSGNSNYAAALQVQQTVTVNEESQTISITSTAPSESYGSLTSYTPTATATSGLSVTFTIDASSTAGTCSIASGVVSFSSPGNCVIDANQSGNSNYAAAPQVQQVIIVAKESQTISITSTAPSETYGSLTSYTPTATATSTLTVTFTIDSSSTAGTCSIASGVVSFSAAGTCVIDANQSGNSDYAAAPQVQQVITVAKESQTISITSTAPSETYGSLTSYTPTATATSTLSVTFTIDATSTPGTCSISGGVVSFSAAGTCVIDANQSGNSDYAPAPQAQQVIGVNKSTQTISFTSTAPSETYGSLTSYTPTATATSTLSVTFTIDASSTTGTCSIASGVVSFSSPGTCVIDANQSGNSDYAAAPQVQQSITVDQESQTISITSSAPSETYGSTTNYTPAATATSGLSVIFSIDPLSGSICSISGGVVSFTSGGKCIVEANQSGNSDYAAAPQVQQSITVDQESQTISFTSGAPLGATAGGASYTPTATATSALSVTFSIDPLSGSICSISGGVVSFTSGGTCVVDANQSGNSDYAAAPQVQQVITVAKESQTISITSTAPSETYGSTTNYTPTATATSGLSVTFTIDPSSTAGTCSITSGVVSFSNPGSCIIDANQSGNSDYSAATQVEQSVVVEQKSQTISFTSTAPSETYGSTTNYTPTATATSGLSVVFSINIVSASICSISGGVVSFTSGGTCIIDANQSGNSDYSAATQVEQSVVVEQKSQTISFTSTAPSETYGSTTNYTPTATATSGLSALFTIDSSSTSGTCSISGGIVTFTAGGTCVIDANQSGNNDYLAASEVQQVVTVGKESQTVSFTSSVPSDATAGGASYTPTATATSGLGVTFTIDASSTSGTCSIASGAVSFSSPGTCIIDANQAGNNDYLVAPQMQQVVSVITGTVPGTPSDINTVYGADSLNFSWNAPSNNGGLPISDYNVSVKDLTTGTVSQSVEAYSTSYDATSLTPGDLYQVSVAAVNSAGASAPVTSDTYEAAQVTASSGATWSGVAVSSNQGITVGNNTPGSSSISATASSGTGTLAVSDYPSSPFPKLPNIAGSKFFATNLSSQETFGNVSVEICGVQSGGSVKWWNPATQTLETPSDITSLGNGCFEINTNSTSIPNVQGLIGGTFVSIPPGSSAVFGNSGNSGYQSSSGEVPASKVTVSKNLAVIRKGEALDATLTCQGPIACVGKITILLPEKVKKRIKGNLRMRVEQLAVSRGSFNITSGRSKVIRYRSTSLGKKVIGFDIAHHIKLKQARFIITLIKSQASQVSLYYPHLDVLARLIVPTGRKKIISLRADCAAQFTCNERALLLVKVQVGKKVKWLPLAHGVFRLQGGQIKNISMYLTKYGITVFKSIPVTKKKRTFATLDLLGNLKMKRSVLLFKK